MSGRKAVDVGESIHLSPMRSILLLALFLCLPAIGGGVLPVPPTGRFMVQSYGLEQGLESLPVQAMAQDTRGFIWVGTDAGLFRYDGERFQRYGLEEGLSSTFVNHLLSLPNGEFYAGSFGGVMRLDGDRFEVLGPRHGLETSPVLGLAGDASGRLWVANAQGLWVKSAKGIFAPAPGWPGGACHSVLVAEGGQPVFASQEGEILEWTVAGWHRYGRAEGLGGERIDRMVLDGQGRLWARSARHLWMRPPAGGFFENHTRVLPGKSSVGYLAVDRKGRVWLPTDEGLAYLEEGRWVRFGPQQGLPTSWARAVLQDREGSIWIGSMGIHRILGRGSWRGFGIAEGMPGEVIWSIDRDTDGRLWVGTDRGLVVGDARGWTPVPDTWAQAVRSMVLVPGEGVWFTGAPTDLLHWNPQNRRLRRFGPETGLKGTRIYCLRRDRSGVWWAATSDAGLLRGEIKDGTPHFRQEALPDGRPTERISWVIEDRSGRLWAMGERGVAIRENGRWRRFGSRDGLRADHLSYGLELRNGEIWLAYFEPGGIVRVRLREGGLEVAEHRQVGPARLPSKVYSLGEDSKGRLWVGTGNGLEIFGPGDRVEHFGSSDGLIGEDCNAMAYRADPGGNVWLGTSQGLAHYHADADLGALGSPEPLVTEVRSAGQLRLFPEPGSGVTFRPGRGGMDLRYSTLTFVNENRREFLVHLQGLDDRPRTTRQRELHIPSLPKGRFRLEIRTRIPPADWSPAFVLWIEVPPFWWQTWWARTLGAFAVLSLAGLVLRWRVKHLRQVNRRLEDVISARTRELQEANESLRALSLTDPLTGMRNRRFLHMVMPEDTAQIMRAFDGLKAGAGSVVENLGLLFLMVDLDHFKSINDTFGHHAGDAVLQQMRPILERCVRDSDMVVRWGGEEFLVVARSANRNDVAVLAERIRRSVAQHAFDIGSENPLRPTCSVGCVPFPFLPWAHHAMTWERAIDLADCCLYAAKHAGRNTWVALMPEPDLQAENIPEDPAMGIPAWLESGKVRVLSNHSTLQPEVWLRVLRNPAP